MPVAVDPVGRAPNHPSRLRWREGAVFLGRRGRGRRKQDLGLNGGKGATECGERFPGQLSRRLAHGPQ